MAKARVPLELRLWAKVRKSPRCWLWTGTQSRRYGQVWLDGRQQYVHRVVYELRKGPIPPGLTVDHKCGTPLCVRPSHLRLLTLRANTLAGRRNPAARNARKTHCIRGHRLVPTVLRRYGPVRRCYACERLYYAAKHPGYRPRPSGRYPRRHPPDLQTVLWANVRKARGCWHWLGPTFTTPKGEKYGVLVLGGKRQYAHCAVYELLVGPLRGRRQRPFCATGGLCVRPEHWEWKRGAPKSRPTS